MMQGPLHNRANSCNLLVGFTHHQAGFFFFTPNVPPPLPPPLNCADELDPLDPPPPMEVFLCKPLDAPQDPPSQPQTPV